MDPFTYTRIYSDDGGESHLEQVALTFDSSAFAPPAPPLGVSAPEAAASTRFLNLPAGWRGELHVTPVRQWLFCLRGEMHFETSGGARFAALPGAAILLEDTRGRGHRSWVPGPAPVLLAAVALP
jgi:hypothetical protein